MDVLGPWGPYEDFLEELEKVVRVLCGTSKISSDGEEKNRRLFQFMFWLNDDLSGGKSDDLNSLINGSTIYAGLRISKELEVLMNHRRLSPQDALQRLTRKSEIRSLLGVWLQGQTSLWSGVPPFRNTDPKKGKIRDSLNLYVELCLRGRQNNPKKSKDLVYEDYVVAAKADPRIYDQVKPLLHKFRARLAFLYIARNRTEMINMPEREKLFQDLEKQSLRTRNIRNYFVECARVQQVIQHGPHELQDTDIARWAKPPLP